MLSCTAVAMASTRRRSASWLLCSVEGATRLPLPSHVQSHSNHGAPYPALNALRLSQRQSLGASLA